MQELQYIGVLQELQCFGTFQELQYIGIIQEPQYSRSFVTYSISDSFVTYGTSDSFKSYSISRVLLDLQYITLLLELQHIRVLQELQCIGVFQDLQYIGSIREPNPSRPKENQCNKFRFSGAILKTVRIFVLLFIGFIIVKISAQAIIRARKDPQNLLTLRLRTGTLMVRQEITCRAENSSCICVQNKPDSNLA